MSALIDNEVLFNEFLGIEIDDTLESSFSNDGTNVFYGDFCYAQPAKKYDLLITNPPYTRHHLIGQKSKLEMAKLIKTETGIVINGLSGLHCYFILLADKWLKDNAIAVWLLPTEFLDINYGKELKSYLLNNVQLLQVHTYDTSSASLFNDAIVSSCVIVYQKKEPEIGKPILFTYGESMSYPKQSKTYSLDDLSNSLKWTKLEDNTKENTSGSTLSDYFSIKRGIATGYNKYFILSREEIEAKGLPFSCFTPIIENARNVSTRVIENDKFGYPNIKPQLFVLDTDLCLTEISNKYPVLFDYLNYGINIGVTTRYLVSKRKIWYKQESRTPAPFYCAYMTRKKENGDSFSFILNKSNTIVSNNFLMMYPKNRLETALKNGVVTDTEVYSALDSISYSSFSKKARTYATGLSKLEPSELGQVSFSLNI